MEAVAGPVETIVRVPYVEDVGYSVTSERTVTVLRLSLLQLHPERAKNEPAFMKSVSSASW